MRLPWVTGCGCGPERKCRSTVPSSTVAQAAGSSVCRLVTEPDALGEGFATAFLVADELVLTNHHVFPSAAEARGVAAQFFYEYQGGALQVGEFHLVDPDKFFLTNEDLDFSLVAIYRRSTAGIDLGPVPATKIIPETPKILIGQPVNIIEHPEGGPKRWAESQNELVVLDDKMLFYKTDTLEGSSGSPAFNFLWELVALHSRGVPQRDSRGRVLTTNGGIWNDDMDDSEIGWVANAGIRAHVIAEALLAELASMQKSDPERAALLKRAFAETDSGTINEAASAMTTTTTPPQLLGQTVINVYGQTTFVVGGATAPQANGAPKTSSVAPVNAELVVAPEKALRFDPHYDRREGYDVDFLDVRVPHPQAASEKDLLKGDDGSVLVLDYHHYSLVMNKARKLQLWSAANVDYSAEMRDSRSRKELGDETWHLDPRIPAQFQMQNRDVYQPAHKVDRGHIFRREDGCWGATPLAREYGNSDTYHWTNCTPQHERFNKSSMKGLWGLLENHIQEQSELSEPKLSLFGGPVLKKDDPFAEITDDYGDLIARVQYPTDFWKIVLVPSGSGVLAYGFVLSQEDVVRKEGLGLEVFEAGRWAANQRSIKDIQVLTGVTFDAVVIDGDALEGGVMREVLAPEHIKIVKPKRRGPAKTKTKATSKTTVAKKKAARRPRR